MDMENKLHSFYKEKAKQLHTSTGLDEKILSNAKLHGMPHRREKIMMKKMYKQAIVLVALIVVLSGFGIGAKLLLTKSTDNVTLNYLSSQQFNTSEKTMTKARLAISEVKEQLELGEYAVIYFPDISREFPLLSAANLKEEQSWEQWSSELLSANQMIPSSLLGGAFTFETGMNDHPFYTKQPVYQEDLIAQLKQQQNNSSANEIIWTKVELSEEDLEFVGDYYATKYSDENGMAIYVTAFVIGEEEVRIDSFINDNSDLKNEDYGNKSITYVKYDHALTNTGVLQSVDWLEEMNGASVLYSVTTEDQAVSEAMLREAATEIINLIQP